MFRIVPLVAALLAAAPALADTPATMLRGNMPSLSQGRGAGQRFAPAPVPNASLVDPTRQRDTSGIQVSPGLTRTNTGQVHGGDGYANGTAYSSELERRGRGGIGANVAPSLNLKMPVQVDFR